MYRTDRGCALGGCRPVQYRPLTLLGMGGGPYRPPPFFNGQIVKKTLIAKNLKKFLSLLLDLFFVHYASTFIKTI
jgi:hypothetical protein